uniref:Uncharacterized protein n=1 Tax=Glossina morsitans morsitans TaxID=37546 RepID=A0A1B0G3K3_GLOMM
MTFPVHLRGGYKFPGNKQITQGNQRSNVALGEGLQELNEFDEVTNKMLQNEVVNNPVTSIVSAGFQTANRKQISISEEGQKSVQNILREFQGNLQETDDETELKDIKARYRIKVWNPSLKKPQAAVRK